VCKREVVLIGHRIKTIREYKGLKSQRAFAKILEISPSFMNQIESGKKQPNIDLICSISEKFNINLNWLLTGHSSMFNDDVVKIPFMNEKEKFIKMEKHLIEESLNASPEDLVAIKADTDLNFPTIKNDDILIVDRVKSQLEDGGLFLIKFKKETVIRRIALFPNDELMLGVDNVSMKDSSVSCKNSDVQIFGKIIWHCGKLQ